MTEVLVPIGIILLLVLANGLFVAAEFAIVGASRARDRASGRAGQPRWRSVWRYILAGSATAGPVHRDYPGRHLGGKPGTRHVRRARRWPDWLSPHLRAVRQQPLDRRPRAGEPASLSSVLTYLHIVIGEMVPKALALQRAERTVLYVSPVILAHPDGAAAAWSSALNAIGNRLLRLIGVRRQEVDAERYHTTEELQYIIEESQEGGMLRGESGRILQRAVRVRRSHGGRGHGAARGADGHSRSGPEPDELRADRSSQSAHAVSDLRRRSRPHHRQPSHQESASAPASLADRSQRKTPARCRTSLDRRRSTKSLP